MVLRSFAYRGGHMNFHKLTEEIARREGKKKQISIAQIKEVVRILADVMYRDDGWPSEYGHCFIKYAKGKKKPKKK